MLYPEKLLLVGGACSHTRHLAQPTTKATVGLGVYGYLPLSLGQESLWSLLAPVRTACTLPGLRHHIGWALAKGILEGASLHENAGTRLEVLARFVQFLLWKGTWSHFRELLL